MMAAFNPGTPISSKGALELQETDSLIHNKHHHNLTPLSYSFTNLSTASQSYTPSTASYRVPKNELLVVLAGTAAGNFLEWYNFSIFGLLADDKLWGNIYAKIFMHE